MLTRLWLTGLLVTRYVYLTGAKEEAAPAKICYTVEGYRGCGKLLIGRRSGVLTGSLALLRVLLLLVCCLVTTLLFYITTISNTPITTQPFYRYSSSIDVQLHFVVPGGYFERAKAMGNQMKSDDRFQITIRESPQRSEYVGERLPELNRVVAGAGSHRTSPFVYQGCDGAL